MRILISAQGLQSGMIFPYKQALRFGFLLYYETLIHCIFKLHFFNKNNLHEKHQTEIKSRMFCYLQKFLIKKRVKDFEILFLRDCS